MVIGFAMEMTIIIINLRVIIISSFIF
jgi:hypothetical protein